MDLAQTLSKLQREPAVQKAVGWTVIHAAENDKEADLTGGFLVEMLYACGWLNATSYVLGLFLHNVSEKGDKADRPDEVVDFLSYRETKVTWDEEAKRVFDRVEACNAVSALYRTVRWFDEEQNKNPDIGYQVINGIKDSVLGSLLEAIGNIDAACMTNAAYRDFWYDAVGAVEDMKDVPQAQESLRVVMSRLKEATIEARRSMPQGRFRVNFRKRGGGA